MKVTDNFPAPYLRPRAFVTLHRLGIIKYFHAHLAIGKLLIRMPRIEMDHKIVLLVESEAADEAPQLGLLLVLGLDVGKQERPLGELLAALGAGPAPGPLAVLLGHVQVVQPPLLEDRVTLGAGEALARFNVEFLMFL